MKFKTALLAASLLAAPANAGFFAALDYQPMLLDGRNMQGYSGEVGWRFTKYFAASVGAMSNSTVENDRYFSVRGQFANLYLLVPLGDSGFIPYISTGITSTKAKIFDFTAGIDAIPATTTTPAVNAVPEVFKSIIHSTRVWPSIGGGLTWSYSSIGLRAGARVQPIETIGGQKALWTFSGGVVFGL